MGMEEPDAARKYIIAVGVGWGGCSKALKAARRLVWYTIRWIGPRVSKKCLGARTWMA